MKKIALTGASGFIGKKLLKSLIKEYGSENIVVIASKENPEVDTILYDKETKKFITDQQVQAEIVIHVGAYTPKSTKDADNIGDCNSNISFTAELINRIDENRCKKIVNISTLDVYSSEGMGIINENTLINPSTLYGASKLYCEKMISTYATKFKISLINLRLGHIFGKGEEQYQKIIPITIRRVLNEEPIEIYGDGMAIRSFLNVDDAVTAICNALRKDIEINTINVVSENRITISDLVKKIVSYSDKNLPIRYKETEVPNKNFVFDATLLKKYLLSTERDFDIALKEEYEYTKNL